MNFRKYIIKCALLIATLLIVLFIFKLPIDYFHIKLLSEDPNRIFSKGDALKVLTVALIFFTLYAKDKIKQLKHPKQKKLLTAAMITSGFIAVGIYYLLRYIYNINEGINYYLIYTASLLALIAAFAFICIGIFGWKYLKIFYKKLRKPILITFILTIITYLLLMQFQALWPFFSYYVTMILYKLYSPIFPTYLELAQEPVLDVNGFVVSIGSPCSGTESMFLFIVFTIGIYLLDRKHIRNTVFIISSIIGFIGIYLVNILRLFLLILTGIYVDPGFAVGLFHTNIGWLLFVVYFLIYYFIIRKFIYKRSISRKR